MTTHHAAICVALVLMSAGPQPPYPSTAEPPLADAPPPPAAVAPPAAQAADGPPTPVVALRVRVPATAADNQELEYHLCVENCSEAAAHHVLVRNPLPANARFVRATPEPSAKEPELLWRLGTLPAGARRDITLILAPTGPGEVHDCARVQFEHGQCVCTKVVGTPQVALTKTGPERRYVNRAATYRITVRNPGGEPLANVVVSDPLPDRAKFIRAGGNGRLENNVVRWRLGELAPGASRTFDLVLAAGGSGRVCNQATATADGGATARADACTEFVGVPGLLMEVVDTDDPVEVGGETAYAITVLNQGTEAATRVVVTAEVPTQMTLVRATGPAEYRQDGAKVVFAPLTLQARQEARFRITVKALQAGDVRFRAELTADQLTGGPVRQEESTTIYRPDRPGRLVPEPGR